MFLVFKWSILSESFIKVQQKWNGTRKRDHIIRMLVSYLDYRHALFAWSFIKISTTCLRTTKALATKLMHRLAWAFTGRLCDKFLFLFAGKILATHCELCLFGAYVDSGRPDISSGSLQSAKRIIGYGRVHRSEARTRRVIRVYSICPSSSSFRQINSFMPSGLFFFNSLDGVISYTISVWLTLL